MTEPGSAAVCEPCQRGDHLHCTSQGWGGCRCEPCYSLTDPAPRGSAAAELRAVRLCPDCKHREDAHMLIYGCYCRCRAVWTPRFRNA